MMVFQVQMIDFSIFSEVNLQSPSYGFTWGSDFNNFYQGYVIDRYSNQNVTWEVAEKTNYGLELGLFNSLNFQIDYFTEHRSKIYMSRDYIPCLLYTSPSPRDS